MQYHLPGIRPTGRSKWDISALSFLHKHVHQLQSIWVYFVAHTSCCRLLNIIPIFLLPTGYRISPAVLIRKIHMHFPHRQFEDQYPFITDRFQFFFPSWVEYDLFHFRKVSIYNRLSAYLTVRSIMQLTRGRY